MSSFASRGLYGGAITVNLPADFIDSSTLRQIPDHQEVYLSPGTLTSIVLEINQYVTPSLTASHSDADAAAAAAAAASIAATASVPEATTAAAAGTGAVVSLNDNAAALYHLHDLVDPSDTLTIISTPKAIQMHRPSLQGLPALLLRAKLTSREEAARTPSAPPETYHHTPDVVQTSTSIRLLLTRLAGKATDLCVSVNVPWKELEGRDGAVEAEEAFAERVVEELVGSLDVRDWGLFGD